MWLDINFLIKQNRVILWLIIILTLKWWDAQQFIMGRQIKCVINVINVMITHAYLHLQNIRTIWNIFSDALEAPSIQVFSVKNLTQLKINSNFFFLWNEKQFFIFSLRCTSIRDDLSTYVNSGTTWKSIMRCLLDGLIVNVLWLKIERWGATGVFYVKKN